MDLQTTLKSRLALGLRLEVRGRACGSWRQALRGMRQEVGGKRQDKMRKKHLRPQTSDLKPNAAESETPQTYSEALLQPIAAESEVSCDAFAFKYRRD